MDRMGNLEVQKLESHILELRKRIRELEGQNLKLQESLDTLNWQLMKSEMLRESLLKRIIQLKNAYEGRKEEKEETRLEKILGFQEKSQEDLILEKIFEDESFKKEIEEARKFKRELKKMRIK
ncbi:MAG: hypothetical protein ACE5K0_05875 [Candidatus Methanofastidiosia archaeon]